MTRLNFTHKTYVFIQTRCSSEFFQIKAKKKKKIPKTPNHKTFKNDRIPQRLSNKPALYKDCCKKVFRDMKIDQTDDMCIGSSLE